MKLKKSIFRNNDRKKHRAAHLAERTFVSKKKQRLLRIRAKIAASDAQAKGLSDQDVDMIRKAVDAAVSASAPAVAAPQPPQPAQQPPQLEPEPAPTPAPKSAPRATRSSARARTRATAMQDE